MPEATPTLLKFHVPSTSAARRARLAAIVLSSLGAPAHAQPQPYVVMAWLAVGATRVEPSPTSDACFRRVDELRHLYEKAYVVRSIACFPRELVIEAGK
jgi:hypothetical protein